MKKLTAENFWERVDVKTNDDACWEWKNYRNAKGYGYLKFQGSCGLAHRVAAYLSGIISTIEAPKDRKSDQFILHECDNPACCNPRHLKAGSYSQNQKDAYSRGLKPRIKGDKHVNAKQTAENVQNIRHLAASGVSQRKLAAQFNTSQNAIHNIVRHKTYSPA